jgi:hypothetical protein
MIKKVLSLVGFVILSSFPISAPANDVAKETGTASIKETIIFIPAREMKSILGIEKEGVFVTYDEYKTLYEKAKNEYMQREPRAFILPGAEGLVIIQANYSGSVIGELLQFEARFKIVQNKKGPSFLDFPLPSKVFVTRVQGSTGKRCRFIRKTANHGSLSQAPVPMILLSGSFYRSHLLRKRALFLLTALRPSWGP